jgi:formylglycine-generating enzyme required for sulfatase activity
MHDLPRQKLRELINHHGTSLCENAELCESLLFEACAGKYKHEILMLVDAIEDGVAKDLLNPPPDLPKEEFFTHLVDRLQENFGLKRKRAMWTVQSWEMALEEKLTTSQSSKVLPKPRAKSASNSLSSVKRPIYRWLGAAGALVVIIGLLVGYLFLTDTKPRSGQLQQQSQASEVIASAQQLQPQQPSEGLARPPQKPELQAPQDAETQPKLQAPQDAETSPKLQVPQNTETSPKVQAPQDAETSPKVFRDRLQDGSLGPEMVVIPAGRFQMGDIRGEGEEDEQVHWVSMASFAMGRYEVTFAEYDRFAEATGRKKPSDNGWGRGNRPVIHVAWKDAIAYAQWLSQQTGQSYRLPTEAEWEYSARATTKTARYWGNNPNKGCRYGNIRDETLKQEKKWSNIHHCTDGYVYTAPVGQFQPNAFGLFDMLGNAWEWTCSEYHKDYNGKEQRCIDNPSSKKPRSLRGGSWGSKPWLLRSAERGWDNPSRRNIYISFRVAKF